MSLILPYTLKRFIAQFLMPVPLVIEVFVLGWVLGRFTRFKRTGTVCKVLAGCLFLAFSYGLGSSYIWRIERQYPPFDPTPVQCEQLRGSEVLVLGQGMVAESDLPLRYRVNATFYQRLLEGVRISRLIPESRIIVSMPGDASSLDKAQFVEDYAQTVGVPRSRFEIIGGARDTSEEVRMALNIARTNTLIVATSATHIPRALELVRSLSGHPIAAPCDYTRQSATSSEINLSNLPLPSSHGFELSKRAAHEWMGSMYEALAR
jgi:uncharacterized SAM-binding protein YcdF (DUF218 family)